MIIIDKVSDIFGIKGLEILSERLDELPPNTQLSVENELILLESIQNQIEQIESRIDELVFKTEEHKLLMTIHYLKWAFCEAANSIEVKWEESKWLWRIATIL